MGLTIGRRQILLYLANRKKPVHPVEIYRNAKPAGMGHPNSVLKAVKEMAIQGFMLLENVGTEEGPSYRCSFLPTRDMFLALVKEFLESNDLLQFLISRYVQEMINSKLVDYIQERLKTYWDENQKVAVLQMLRMSPSALHAALFSEGTLSQDSDAVVRKEQPFVFENPKMFEKHKEISNSSALALLQSNLISDVCSDQTTRNEKVQTCIITLETFFDSRPSHECAKKNDLGNILKLRTMQGVGYYKVAGSIKRGQLLSRITKKEPKRKRAAKSNVHRSVCA